MLSNVSRGLKASSTHIDKINIEYMPVTGFMRQRIT
jgi:hypothetical protein